MINPSAEIIEVEQTATAKAVYRDLAEQTDTLAPAMRRSLSILFGPRFRYPTPKALIEDNPWKGCEYRFTVKGHNCHIEGCKPTGVKKPGGNRIDGVFWEYCRKCETDFEVNCRCVFTQRYLTGQAERAAGLLAELSDSKDLLDSQRQDYRQLAAAWESTVAASILLLKHIDQLNRLSAAAKTTGRTEQVTQIKSRIVEIDSSIRQLHTETAPALHKHARKAKAEIEYQKLAAELDMQASNPIVDALHQQVDDAIKSIAALPALTKPD